MHEPPPAPPEATEAPAPRPVPRTRRKQPKLPSRKQINMTPETQRMIEELIDHVQTYSVQRDTKGSEVFHALVLSLYEAREHLDLSEVPARGRWGTPTAQSFPISLKNAFQAAISAAHKKNRKQRPLSTPPFAECRGIPLDRDSVCLYTGTQKGEGEWSVPLYRQTNC